MNSAKAAEGIWLSGSFDVVARTAAAPGKLAIISVTTGNWLHHEGQFYVASTMDQGQALILEARLQEAGLQHGTDFVMMADGEVSDRACLKWMSLSLTPTRVRLFGPRSLASVSFAGTGRKASADS